MTQMLRHKQTGELFIYTAALAKLDELEPVVEDPVVAALEAIAIDEAIAGATPPETTVTQETTTEPKPKAKAKAKTPAKKE